MHSRELASPSTTPHPRARRLWKTAAAGLLAVSAPLMLSASPAQASGAAVSPGWYSSQPMALDTCTKPVVLAVGSDKQPMTGQIWVTKTGFHKAQGVVVFDNTKKRLQREGRGVAAGSRRGQPRTSDRWDPIPLRR